MKTLSSLCPAAPDWVVDWDRIDHEYEWIQALRGCEQDPEWHAEGDVWVHTRMVLEALTELAVWRSLGDEDREAVFMACLLHDVEKPSTTRREEDGRITARGHSWRGAIRARRILWRMGVPFDLREQVCGLIEHHQIPLFLAGREDSEHTASGVSWVTRCDLLALVAEADVRGRQSADRSTLLENIELFSAYCEELGCLDRPRDFPSDSHRVEYFRSATRQPDSPAPLSHPMEVTVMSGLPGAGKDYWIAHNLPGHPMVSPDEIRRELGISPAGNQGRVIQEAWERARGHLREQRDFVWNATNLSLRLRGEVTDLFRRYGARIRIVYVEASAEEWEERNRTRPDMIPRRAIERMLTRWQVPKATEAHEVLWHEPAHGSG